MTPPHEYYNLYSINMLGLSFTELGITYIIGTLCEQVTLHDILQRSRQCRVGYDSNTSTFYNSTTIS